MRRHTWSGPQKPTHHNRDGERLVSILPPMSTEEDLLQEHYMGNRQSRQLFLGYTGAHHQSDLDVGRRGKVSRAISVGSSRLYTVGMHPFSGRTLVGASGVGSDG